jgi:uncharacterized protein YyaL (SSP411 family)
MTLDFLLRRIAAGDARGRAMVRFTLDRMADGGIHDQLGGGFARYSTDARWLVPHFEKMLYDNALLAHCYLEAFRAFGVQRFAEVAGDTLDFMLRELGTDDGGFAAALDADSEGEEGRFYAWTHEEFTRALSDAGLDDDAASALAAYWGVTPGGNWEGRSILTAGATPPPPDNLDRGRRALLEARELRTRPARDEKQLAAWNGMALRALSAGALLLRDERYGTAVQRLADFVGRHLVRDGDRLWRTVRDGIAHTPAFGEDYANVVDGLLAAHAATGDTEVLLLARTLTDRLVADFWDEASGTLFDTSGEHELTVARPQSLIDSATPAANSVAADVLMRLALLCGEADDDRRARSILRAVAPALDRQPSMFGRMLCAVDRSLGAPSDAVIAAADAGDVLASKLRHAVARPFAPDLVIASVEPGSVTADWPVFAAKTPVAGVPTAYVCRGYACEAPTSDPRLAASQVERMAPGRASAAKE